MTDPTDLQRWLRQSIYDAPNSDSRKRILDEYVQDLLAVARAAAWVRKAFELDGDDNDFAAEFCAALDKLETDQWWSWYSGAVVAGRATHGAGGTLTWIERAAFDAGAKAMQRRAVEMLLNCANTYEKNTMEMRLWAVDVKNLEGRP